jgi:hypothetical protein
MLWQETTDISEFQSPIEDPSIVLLQSRGSLPKLASFARFSVLKIYMTKETQDFFKISALTKADMVCE